MSSESIPVNRLPIDLRPDPSRVLVRPFLPAVEPRAINPADPSRVRNILNRILALEEGEVDSLLQELLVEFGNRHQRIRDILLERFQELEQQLPADRPLSEARKLLIGSYFTSEYAFESAALFNPSMVLHPDQSGLPDGSVRFIMSLRATGEGHISSIIFRSGVVDGDGGIALDPPSRFVTEPQPVTSLAFDRGVFSAKISELGLRSMFSDKVLASLPETFSIDELSQAVAERTRHDARAKSIKLGERMILLARSSYDLLFEADQPISERIIFPFSPSQSNGIEDARFVRFADEKGVRYYATYTAYDGRVILPQLLETEDFLHFKFSTLNGPAVQNKGMALFPRKIGGRYCMLSRQDNENIRIMWSDHLHTWQDSHILTRPEEPWEFVQLGNCGSPLETPAGWLLLTHGVGPMRKYCIGAMLLDLEHPHRVIGRLKRPLIQAGGDERNGYVPNVVYSCGAMIHGKNLILPYGLSDSLTTFATVPLAALLEAMRA